MKLLPSESNIYVLEFSLRGKPGRRPWSVCMILISFMTLTISPHASKSA